MCLRKKGWMLHGGGAGEKERHFYLANYRGSAIGFSKDGGAVWGGGNIRHLPALGELFPIIRATLALCGGASRKRGHSLS